MIWGCGPAVCLWDPWIQWIGGILHSSMSLGRIIGKLIHSQVDIRGVTKSLTIGRGILFLKIRTSHGAIDVGTIEALWQVGPSLDHHIDCDQDLCKRRLWYEHAI